MTPETVLQSYWGYSNFRPLQRQIIEAILQQSDVLTLLPTGGGKSICYQVPGIILPGITIVISPLISLMKDQVDALLAKNIPASYLASTLSKSELSARYELLNLGKFKFLYLSPERLFSKKLSVFLKRLNISLVVIDEAHCISLWGSDFRPEYQQLARWLTSLPTRPPVAAFTATATPSTQRDIIQHLALKNPQVFRASFARLIGIEVKNCLSTSEHELQLLHCIKTRKNQSGIIYTTSRQTAEQLCHRLTSLHSLLQIENVSYYHAGLPASQRQATQQLFLENRIQLLVATTAFGMGIDKPNIEYVIHYHFPSSIEAYYQEIGRAGRNGQLAAAVLLYTDPHLAVHQSLLEKLSSKKAQLNYQKKANDVLSYIHSTCCRMQMLLEYFGERSQACGMCDNCEPLQAKEKYSAKLLLPLLKWRRQVSQEAALLPEFILTGTQLKYLLLLLPDSLEQLSLLPGFGEGWISLWGNSFLTEWYNTREEIVQIKKKIYGY